MNRMNWAEVWPGAFVGVILRNRIFGWMDLISFTVRPYMYGFILGF